MYKIPAINIKAKETLSAILKAKEDRQRELLGLPELKEQEADGTRSKEQGTRSKEQGTRSKEQGTKSKEQSSRSKRTEFPCIDWDDRDDKDVQLAQLLYNDRVEIYHRMREMLDQVAKNKEQKLYPDFGKEFARLDDRNRQAQAELESFNTTGTWLSVHPIVKRGK